MLFARRSDMDQGQTQTLFYKRSHFVTHLPVEFRYSPSHFWIANSGASTWRVGLTRFATRMLGEMVDHGFEATPHSGVSSGQIIGWVEGFKAISDVYCIGDGTFLGTNPALVENITLISRDPYAAGWLYSLEGAPDPRCVDVNVYKEILDRTIDRILEKQKAEEET